MHYINSTVKAIKNNKIESVWFIGFSILGALLPWFFIDYSVAAWGMDGMYTLTIISVFSTLFGLTGGLMQIGKKKTANIWNAISFVLTGYVLWFNGMFFVAITDWALIVPILLYGTYEWFKSGDKEIETREMKLKTFISIFVGATILGLGLSSIMAGINNSWTSWWVWFDGILAVWMTTGMIILALRYRDAYKVFVILNVFYVIYTVLQVAGVGLDENQVQLIPTLILYFAFLLSATWGLFKWKQ